MTEGKKRLKLPKSIRLKHSSDFKRLREKGQRIVCGCLILNWIALPEGSQSKIGVVTSRRLGSPVERNRCRRLLREVFRVHQHDLVQPAEIVLVARDSIKGLKFQDVEQDFLKALKKAGLLRNALDRI
ncbi:MAG: ribonuclease P protein component [Verrucomicrobiia bacterium]|jgi:ribonuclease P protein component